MTHTFARKIGLALLAAVVVTIAMTARATAERAGNRAAAAADADRSAQAAGRATAVALTAVEPLNRSADAGEPGDIRALPVAYAADAAAFVTATGRACALLSTSGPATVTVEGAGYHPVQASWTAGGWHIWCWTGLRAGTTYRVHVAAEPGMKADGIISDH
ncbi:MAG: hypothetical protein HOU81_20670 [Hamadaea sp.]|uniref:hypothetical protein n=1 Tax=Hamadaea sp. TaxID=2024425 RepID=UPI00179827B7|nr:hypothetical protein [Hamadaea sp.]NUR73240.1 hypothetical protein [Hamadaea sp.]NUT20243.1 hypothetical protein [Hamadaea sp.]